MRINDVVRCVVFLVFAACLNNSANANVIVGLLLNPASTSGVTTSTRSGPGSWHIYAIEDSAATDLGISGYSVTMSGITTINHRSPNGSALNSDGDPQTWGFSNLRSAAGVIPVGATQPLPGSSTYLITGFGREASNATAKLTAIDAGTTGISAISGASWGAYNSPVLNSSALLLLANGSTASAAAAAMDAGRKWVFLAEGLGTSPTITATGVTVYTSAAGVSIATPSSPLTFFETSVPEPSSVGLLVVGVLACLTTRSRRIR